MWTFPKHIYVLHFFKFNTMPIFGKMFCFSFLDLFCAKKYFFIMLHYSITHLFAGAAI